MRRRIVTFFLVCCATATGCLESIGSTPTKEEVIDAQMREKLLHVGLKRVVEDRDYFVGDRLRVDVLAQACGFSTKELKLPFGQVASQIMMMAQVGRWHFLVVTKRPTRDPRDVTYDQPIWSVSVDKVQEEAPSYSGTQSRWKLRITEIVAPKDRTQPLLIRAEFTAEGKTPVALSQEQFSLRISKPDDVSADFICDAVFAADAPNIFLVRPGEKILLSLKSSANRFGRHEHWGSLPKGVYHFRIGINSGKQTEFDYQWLGSGRSDERDFVIQ